MAERNFPQSIKTTTGEIVRFGMNFADLFQSYQLGAVLKRNYFPDRRKLMIYISLATEQLAKDVLSISLKDLPPDQKLMQAAELVLDSKRSDGYIDGNTVNEFLRQAGIIDSADTNESDTPDAFVNNLELIDTI